MEECVDGEYQDFKSKNGAYVREHFFGKYPELLELVADMTDDEIWTLNRGGHDPVKVYAAYAAAVAPHRPADRDPGQDRQGLRHGRGRRGPEHHPPAEEDGRGRAEGVPRPLRPLRSPTTSCSTTPTSGPPTTAQRPATSASAARPSAAPCRPAGSGRSRWPCPSCRPSTPSWPAPASARSPPPWPSCGSSTRCCATRRSASGSCRSCPTSRAPSAWRACSASSASAPRWASSTSPRTPTS